MGISRLTSFGGALSLVLAAGAAVGCNLDKLIHTPTGRLEVSPPVFTDSAAIGSQAARATTLTIERSGAATMSWSATRARGSAWLSLTPTSGAAPGSVTLSATAAALSTGTHRDTIVLTSTNGDQVAVRIPVVFVVKPCDILPIAPDTMIAARLSPSDCTPPLGPGRFGRVYRLTGSAGDSLSLVMTAGAMGARVVLDSAPPGAAPPLAESTSCAGNPQGSACVWYLRLPRPGSFWIEATTTDPLQTGDFSLSVTRPRPPGAPESAIQLRGDTTDAIPPGAPIAERNVVLQATVRDPDAGDRLRLEAEVKPLSQPFNGSGTVLGSPTGNEQPAYARVTGLADGTSYHWRARGVDQTGRAGAWIAYGADEQAPDFRVEQVATQLRFTSQPANATAGAGLTPAVRVAAQDASGNVITGYTGSITVTIGTNPGGATLAGTTSVAAVSGIATFPGLSLNRTGSGYRLAASAAGFANATSNTFNIVHGAAAAMLFAVQPTTATVATTIAPAVKVNVQDALGNLATGFTSNVTVAIGTNPGSASLGGTRTTGAANGVATFSTLSLDRVGSGYTLTAAASGLPASTSSGFDIVAGAANRLVFTTQPTSAAAGASLPAVRVSVQDGLGNVVTSFTGTVTASISTNPGTGTLSGTVAVAAAAGVATFSTLSINRSGTGYTLAATAGGVTGTTSAAFNITPGAASQLVFSVQPVATAAGGAITPAIRVTAQDALGNVVSGFTSNVTVAISANPGGGALSGTSTVAAVAGSATFNGLSINKTGAGYTLIAAAVGLSSSASSAFTITAAPAAALFLTVQPSDEIAGGVIAPAVQVTARDALGNIATGFTANVTVAIGTNPGSGTLAGTRTIAAAAGVATFSTLSINRTGTGYTLTAAATGLTGVASTAFNITPGAAVTLVFTAQPSDEIAGIAITPAVMVTARDALGNTATAFTGSVTVAIGPSPPPGGGILSGTTSVAAAAGVATFSTLSINRTGAGYTLTGAATGLTGVTSTAFNITPGAATVLVFTVQPSNTPVNSPITPQVRVTGRDALGNVATGFTGTVTVVEGVDGSALNNATLSGTTAVAAVAGVATFSPLRIDQTGTGYTLKAGFGAQPPVAESSTFNVTP